MEYFQAGQKLHQNKGNKNKKHKLNNKRTALNYVNKCLKI